METKVLTQEEITQLKKVQQDKISFIEKFGVLEVQIRELELIRHQLNSNFMELKKTEETLAKSLQQKYGEGSINLEKGEFVGD
jgi:hypothetical protein